MHITMRRTRICVIYTYMYPWPARYDVHIHARQDDTSVYRDIDRSSQDREEGMSAKKASTARLYIREIRGHVF